MTNVLVLGATGRVASEVVKSLIDQPNISLKLTSTRDEGVKALQQSYQNCEVVKADWSDEASLIDAFDDVERVVMIPPDFVLDETQIIPNIVAAYEANPGIEQFIRMIAIPETVGGAADLEEDYLATRSGAALHVVGKPLLEASGLPMTYLNVVAWFTSNLPWFFSEDVKQRRKIILPGDAPRFWITEEDMAACFAKVLIDVPGDHLDKEYILMGEKKFTFSDVADVLTRELGETVTYIDFDATLREAGEEDLIAYLGYESRAWPEQQYRDDFVRLLGRKTESLEDWIHKNRELFL